MTRKLSIILAASSSLIISSTFAATTAQQLVMLQKIVKQQQHEIAAQGKQLKRLSMALSHRQVAKPQSHPKHHNSKTVSKKYYSEPEYTQPIIMPQHGYVNYKTTYRSQLPVIKQVSSGSSSALIPLRSLVIGTNKANVSLSGQMSALAFHANDGQQSDLFFGTNSISNSRFRVKTQFKPSNA